MTNTPSAKTKQELLANGKKPRQKIAKNEMIMKAETLERWARELLPCHPDAKQGVKDFCERRQQEWRTRAAELRAAAEKGE